MSIFSSPLSPGPVTLTLPLPIPGFERFITSYLIPGKKMVLVDPGPKVCVPHLLSTLGNLHIKPEELDYILITHIHIDHAGGLGELMRYSTRVKVVVHPQGIKHLVNPERLWQGSLSTLGEVAEKYGMIDPVPEAALVPAVANMEIDLGDRQLQVIFTPGHAPHHISFWDPKQREAFIGEAAGIYHPVMDIVRPATPPPFDLETSLNSLAKLMSLHPKTLYYCHGGCVPAKRRTLLRSHSQLLRWRDIISTARSRNEEDIFRLLLSKDKELIRLKTLDKLEFERERFFISKSIAGFLSYLNIP